MPIGGSNIGWDNTTPPDGESAGLGDDRIRSLKTSVQEAINNEHNFPSGGGANTGYHLLGSARPYYAAQSLVSSSGSDGRVMLTSDTSRLFGVGSVATSFIGGPTVLSVGTYPGAVPQRHIWVEEVGVVLDSTGNDLVAIPNSGFSGAPYIFLSAYSSSGVPIICTLDSITQTEFNVRSWRTTGAALSDHSIFWRSLGTRVL